MGLSERRSLLQFVIRPGNFGQGIIEGTRFAEWAIKIRVDALDPGQQRWMCCKQRRGDRIGKKHVAGFGSSRRLNF